MDYESARDREIEKLKQEESEEFLPNEERYSPDGANGQPELHVYGNADQGWDVWLNTGVLDHDGLCIAAGCDTRDEAIAMAVKVFEWAAQALQGPPPVEAPKTKE